MWKVPAPGGNPLVEYWLVVLEARNNNVTLLLQNQGAASVGLSVVEEVIAAKPTAEWDEALGKTWITPDQLVIFIYNSLTNVDHFTVLEAK